MTNLTKIFRLLLVAVFCCMLMPNNSDAASGMTCLEGKVLYNGQCCKYNQAAGKYSDCVSPVKTTTNEEGKEETVVNKDVAVTWSTQSCKSNSDCTTEGQQCISGICQVPATEGASNAKASVADVSGCSADYGLFSGLIATGGKIFKGLRELIYVVAGFGIIGVSVGGFFGNLNYKWLGAIVISLVIIATTGELINAVTGCKTFTTSVITDTLK